MSIVKAPLDQLAMIRIHSVRLEIEVIELDQVVKLDELFQGVVALILIFIDEVLVALLDWGVNLVGDVVKTRAKR
jgi:hypothetical protein